MSVFTILNRGVSMTMLVAFFISFTVLADSTQPDAGSESTIHQSSIDKLNIELQLNLITVVLISFVVFIIFLFCIRILNRTKRDPLFFQFSSSQAKRVAILFNVAIIFVTILLSWWGLGDLRNKITKDMLASLQTVLETTEASTTIWAKEKKNNLTDLASNPRLINIVETLVAKHNNKEVAIGSNAQRSLRKFLTEIKRHNDQVGFFIIALDGISIGSMRDTNLDIPNLIVKNRPDLFKKNISGETLFIPPIPTDIRLAENEDLTLATMFFSTPIRNSKNQIIAVLAERHDPYGDFTDLHQLGRIGETGETYSVSKNGKLLTQSRFLNQLRSIGLVKENGQSILTIDIHVPDRKTNTPFQKDSALTSTKLTNMAESLIAGNSDFDTQGYLDYRGINVIGVWSWNNQLGIGTVTEIDFDEAYEGYFHTRVIIFIILLVTLSASVALTITLMLLGSRANRALLQAQDSLEQRVVDRTSELQASEQKLQESEERFDFAIRASDDGVWDWNYQTGDIYYSDRWLDMLGYEPQDKAGSLETWRELCHPDDVGPTIELIETCSNGSKNGFRIEFRMRHKEGHWVPILSQAHVVRHPESKEILRFVGTHTDLTQQKIDEQVLRQAMLAAEEASLAKSDFLATMSHEIRTPLNGVLGMLSLVIHSELTSEQNRKLKMANNSAQSLLNIINDVLDFSKIEAGKLELEYVDFDPVRLLENLAQSMAFKAEEKGVELLIDITKVGTMWINGDPLRLKQIILNLVGNAIKFTEQGDILIRAEINKLADDKLVLTVAVVDSGIGIQQSKLSLLFNSFTQADTSTTRKYGGTGLGLAICKKLVVLMEGRINVESELGQGSTFEFTIPVSIAQTKSKLLTNIEMSKLSILIVDDNATNREIYATHLQSWGAKTTEASSAKEALLLCQNDNVKFDIGLLDMHMLEKNGEILAKELRQLPKLVSMKLMLMTSMSKQQSNANISAIGFNGYLSKPVATSDLFNAIIALATQKDDQLKPNLITESILESYQQLNQPYNNKVNWPANTRILVVEDNRINQLVVKGMLELQSLTCEFAGNGLEGLLSLNNSPEDEPYTLIFMDCQMPELDGYEATKRIRRGDAQDRYKAIPIIAMTAHAMKDEMAKCLAVGMDDFLAKPLDLELLEKALERWCKKQEIENTSLPTESDFGVESKKTIVWDKQSFEKRLNGNKNLIAEIVKLYSQNIDSKLSDLSQAVAKHDRIEIKEVAHAIKGMSGNLSALQVQSISSELEQNAMEGELSYFEESLDNIVSASHELEIELSQYNREITDANNAINNLNIDKSPLDVERFRDWLNKLKYSLENGEFITKDIFESIQVYAFDEILAELIEELQQHVSIFDADSAVITLKKITQQL